LILEEALKEKKTFIDEFGKRDIKMVKEGR
jgi:hypothetical protein